MALALLSDSHQSVEKVLDLTGKVTRTNPFSFANGGYSEVYEAKYQGRPVAVKVLKGSQNPEKFNTSSRSDSLVEGQSSKHIAISRHLCRL